MHFLSGLGRNIYMQSGKRQAPSRETNTCEIAKVHGKTIFELSVTKPIPD